MDLNPSARSPLSLSKPFYEDITKDIPSPVSRGFYDAVSKPAEAKENSAVPARYEMASPGEIAETIGAVGEAVIRTPLQIAGATASAIRGGSREAMADKNSFLTRIIDRANADAEEFQKKYASNRVVIAPLTKLGLPDDITTGTITRFPQQAAFSAVSTGAGLAAGLGTAAVSGPAAPIAGRAAGMAASGGVAYRMQKDNSTKDLYEKLNATSMKTAGRELSPDEWKIAYDKNEGSLIEQGISEAIPEAIGNLVGFELFFGAAKNVFGKQLAKTTIGKTLDKYGAGAAGKLLAEQATEQATETWTQQWQHNIDVEMGLTPGETRRSWNSFDDLRQSNKEVFADILLLSTAMGGAALAGEHIKGKLDTKASAQLVKDVVAENKFGSIPNEFLPAMYEHAQELSDKRPKDKELVRARDAFATEMDKRGIDFDMTSKFKEYLKLDESVKTEGATGEDVARWVSLRDEFKEKNISPDLYQQYLTYQSDINKAVGLQKLIATGKATEPQRKEFNRLTDLIVSKASTFGFDPESIESTGGVAKGEVVKKPLEPAKSAARDILLVDESEAKRKNLTAKEILTEGDVNIQTEDDLTPEALAGIDKKLEIAGTGGARKPLNEAGEAPGKTLDITETVKNQDKMKFDLWDTQETGTPPFVRAKVERLFAEGGEAAVLGEYKTEDTVSAYARYRLAMLDKTAAGSKEPTVGAEPDPKSGQGTTDEDETANLIGKISRGEISKDFEFPESYTPMNISNLWDDLYSVKDAIDTKNKPKLDALIKERNKLKSAKDDVSRARKKKIDEEMDILGSESGFAMHNAETAFASAQEKIGLRAVELLKKEGIEVSEKDQDDIYELVSVLSDAQQNERGWGQPILRQVADEFKAAQKSAAEETPTALVSERLTTLTGRVLTPPGIRTATNRLAIKDATTADSWLRDEAIKEAKAKNDEFNLLQFEGTNAKKLSKGDKEGMHQYLFGDTKPIFEIIQHDEGIIDIKAAGTGGKRGSAAVDEPTDNRSAAKRELDESVKQYRDAGHNINDHGVYTEPEKITIPFGKASGRTGSIDIVEGPDGKFRIGVHISKNYGDFEGRGHAPAIDGPEFSTREEALKAGIESIRSSTKGDDPKTKVALKDLAAFETAKISSAPEIVAPDQTSQAGRPGEINAAGTGGSRTISTPAKLAESEPTTESYVEKMRMAASADEGRRIISQYQEAFATIEREAGLKHSIGKGGSGFGGRGYSTLTAKEKQTILKNVTAKNPELGKKLQALIDDIDSAEPHWKTLLKNEHGGRDSDPGVPAKKEEQSDIKAAGTGGARAPKAKKEPTKAPELKKEEKPAPSAAEVKAKEEETKSKVIKKYLLEHIDEALAARTAYENNKTEDAGPSHIIIDVPMDGKFVIVNDVEHLEKFKKNVAKMKVTAALNKLPQHSDKSKGKSTDLITKEAETEVADYWKKRNEFKAQYEGVPAEIGATKARLAKYEEIKRKVDGKEITLKQLGEEAKAASNEENAVPEAWRDSWFGKTPTYADLTGRIKEIQKELRDLEESIPNLKARINEYYPGLAKEMFETKAVAKERKGNLAGIEPYTSSHSESMKWENKETRIEFELNAPEISTNPTPYWEAGIRHKGWAQEAKKFKTKEEAVKWLEDYDTSKINKDNWGPGEQFFREMFGDNFDEEFQDKITPDNETAVKAAIAGAKRNGPSPEFRALFGGIDPEIAGTTADKVKALADELGLPYRTVEEAAAPEPKADIMKEISEISDQDLDALLDMPEKKSTPPKTTNEAVKNIFAAARDKQKGKIPSSEPKGLDEILSDVVKEGVTGAEEALKGLYELFGGSSLKTFPGGFDEDTYAKAKPHFEAALEHFIQVGKGLREFATSIVKQFGDAVRPYLKQFIQEKRDGVTEVKPEEEGETPINLDENTGKGEGGTRTRRKLTEQEKAEKKAREEAAAEKKARKAAMGEFKNVGYVYDPEKLNQKTKDKTSKSAAKIILDEMVPGKIWAASFAEEATPGTVRLMTQVQKYILTFKEYLTESRERLRYASGKSIDDKIEYWLNYRGGSIDMLKEWATEYGKAIQPVVDAFNGQTSITNIIGRLQDIVLLGARREDGTFPDYSEARISLSSLLNSRDYVQRPNSLYNFLTDSWQHLLADENEILLSEIDINKRGRNKIVIRSGLPDYRADVELKKTEDFQAPFGFKGVGFGEEGWINQEERNRVIPAAFDSFKDLAATIGAPDNGMSLGGELAVQFANLGHKAKGAAAAYFPSVQTINFTRDNGDGTMAHEWGHGLHDLAAQDAKSEINSIIGTFYYVYDFDAGVRLVDDLLAKDSMFLKRMVSSKKQQRIEAVQNEVTSRYEDTVRKSTDYYSTAQQMDADYTARAQEMWARAFEAYVYDTLQGKNNYLVNDFVAAGRVGGKSGVGTKLVYPSGKERETFNATIKHFLEGLVWDESGKPSLKADYVTIEKAHELMLQLQLRYLLDQVEARYKAIWTSEPSKDGYFWYRYDDTSFGPMMQPDGYDGYDKGYASEGQNGTGAVAYLTQLHPDAILDYKLSNIQYEGENPTYISKERGGINGSISEDGTEPLEEVSAKPDGSPDEGGDVREGDRGGGADGEGGTFEHGKQRGATGSSEGDSAEGVHPSPAGNYRITDLTLNDPKSVPIRFGLNLSAVKVLNLVESENRTPTDAEKDILAQYNGWGGMSELFAYDPTAAWAGKAELLKAELTDEETRQAASSSTSSYYTPVPVGQFMWKLAQRLGFENGVVLDPATGANGLFLGTMPADLAQGVALQGIEMDTLSARIASKLYGLAAIENKPFQDVKKPNNRFDLTITNVPFEKITPTDLKHNKGGHSLHNYFINKMLNLTAPGALSMMITTSNTLDSIGAHLSEFAEKAHFVGAIRLPSGIYSATNVATDILVFRKKIEGGKFVGVPAEEWTTTGEDESTGLTINNYFLKHPEMVAGKLEKITGRYGNEQLRVAPEGDLQSNLERIAAAFPDKIVEREAVKEAKSIDDIISAPGTIKEGGAYINDKDEVCEKLDGEEVKLPVATASEQKKAAVARAYVHLLDQVRTVLRAQKTETDDAVVKAEQVKLKKYYDQFVKKFGPINDPKNHDVYVDYTDSAWVIALEEYDPDTGKVTKIADIFTKNITGMASRPDRADTDHDALAMALDEFGYPNLEYMARLRNSDVESVRQGVGDKIVENPETGFLETMDEYLSGNVKRKLAVARDMAQSNPEYARNVSLLEAAQPAEIPQHRITARIGASWISPEHLAEFVKDKMGLRRGLHAIFNFSPVSNEWSMSFSGEERYRRGRGFGENKAEVQRLIATAKRSIEATTVWGTERMDFFELMKCALQGKRPQVTYTVDRKQYLDEVATQAAEVKLQDIQTEFGRWLFADTFRADQAVKRFNDLINTSVPMKANGSHLTFPGKSMWMLTPKEKEALGVTDALTFYPHQMNATWKYLKNGNLYLGHEVGTGKTVTMALIAMEAKRLRGKKKVLYVTLNDSTMGQAVQEIKNLYPMANVLPVRVSTNEQRKQRALQKLALNDFDVAIMRQQDLDRIGLSPESERVFIEEEILELREILEEAKREGARILEQDIQVQLHALEEKLKAPSVHDEAKKKNLFFDDLGIDLLIVDEAHKYKNIPYATRLTRITGLNPSGSPTAKDFFRKTQYLNAQFPKKDGIVLASGTALSNSIAEMYNIQRMLQPQEVKRQGVWSFDRWIANHGDMGSQMEWDGARGQYKVITTNRRIVNAGRLLATAYQNVDSVRADDTPVKRPVIRGGEPQRVKVAPNQYVEDYKKIVLDRCAEIEMDPKNAEYEGVPDNMLRIISNMSKVAIDQRLDHHYANTAMQQDSKIAAASKIMYRRWQEEAKHKGVQLVFADLGIPGKYSDKFKYKTEDEIDKLSPEDLAIYDEEKFEHESASTGFNTYEGLKKELVRLGIPENQIAFIHDADHTNKEKKAANLRSLFKKVNAGDIRVMIGSTSKAGTGVNIQGRVSDIHHLDVWWNYSAWEQRNGRGIRAGNIYAKDGMPGTYIWNYVTETTVDATRWDKVFAKGKVLNAVLGGDINLDVIEDISDETMSAKMMAAEASGDPLMSTQATLLQKVQGLRFEQAAHLDVVRRSRMDLAAIPGRIEALEKCIADYQHSHAVMGKVTAVRFIGDNRTLVLEKHGKEISEALEKAVLADTNSWTENKKAPLLVFGTHTETEVTEEVEGKDGEKKEKKVKKYTFAPLPVKADITGERSDPYGRRLRISGDILSSDRKLADIQVDERLGVGDKRKPTTADIKANVSRTVTEYLSYLVHSEESAKSTIEELKGNEPKLQKVIDTPWAKVDELAKNDKDLREVEAQMAARGVSVGDPATGIPIDKYKGIVPVLEDVADKDGWSFHNGIVYPQQNTTIGIRAKTELSRFLKSGKLKPSVASSYNAPDALNALDGGKPQSPATKPIAYTTVNNETHFWVPAGGSYVTIDPVEWNLLQRIIGKEGSWHYEVRGMGERFLIHVSGTGERDAFIRAKQASFVPQGVKDIDDKAMKAAPSTGETQYAVGEEDTTERGRIDLGTVQSLFPGQNVVQNGDSFTVNLKNGAQATIYGVSEITPNAVSLNAGYKNGLRKGQFVAGSFDGLDEQGRGMIRIVRDNENAPWTVSHESVHWLEKLGVISEMDKATLNARIQKEAKWSKDLSPEENRANWLADFVMGSKPTQTVLAQIWQKVQDFIARVVGIRTAGMIGRELQSGKIFEREPQALSTGGEAYGTGYGKDRRLPKWIGDKVKEAFKKDAIASILIDSGPIQAGPLDGGCRVLARALKRIEPTGKIITIEGQLEDGTWQAEHYGLELDGGMIDGDGYAASRETWAKRFAKNESFDRPYRITEGEVQSEDIPQDAPTEKKLADALVKELASDEADKEPRTEKGFAVYEHLPVFTVTEKGLTRRSRRGNSRSREEMSNGELSETGAVRSDNSSANEVGTNGRRKIPTPGGRVLPYVPEHGTLPTVKSEPIGTWKSSRRRITSLEDAAVIARDNLFRDAQEVFVTIVTDKSGKILAVNQHSTGAPNQSQVYAYFAAGQILNIEGASKVWTVHNHPSGQPKLSEADLSVSSNMGDLVADAGIENMPIIAITPSRYSDNTWSSEPLPPREPAIYELPLLGRKFDQSPEGLESIGSQNEFEEFGRTYLKEGGMVLVSAQRQPVAIIAIDDYSKLRPLHTEILREAEKRNAVDFMIYDAEKTLTRSDFENLAAFAKNTQLEFTTVRDMAGDHYEMIKELWGAVRNSRERKVFYSIAKKKKDSIGKTSWEEFSRNANDYSLDDLAETLRANDPEGLYDAAVKLEWSPVQSVSGERTIVSSQAPDYRLTDTGSGWGMQYRGEFRADFKSLVEAQAFVESEVNDDLNDGQGPLFKAEAVRIIRSKDFRDNFNAIDWKNRGPNGIVQYSVQTDAIDSSSLFPEVDERIKAAKGVKYASLKDRAKDALVTGWEHFTRHFQHLEPETDGAVIDVFRKFQDVPAWAKDETVRQLSGFIGRLSPQGRDVFTMNILLPDMIRDIEDGTLAVEDEDGLPFGYKHREQVQQDYDHFRAIAEGSTAIMEALDRRNTFMASLTDQLIQHKLLKKEGANDPAAYFHHQVLAYMNYKANPNWGISSRDVRTHRKGWQVGRKGSQLDYNTEYVESEFEIISQALTQIETVKSLKEIERLADIKPQLEAEAKDQNMATFNQKIEQAKFVGTYAMDDDPLLPFRAKLAVGFQKLAKLFTTENDMGSLPMEFDDVIEHIVDQEEQRRAAKEDEIEFEPVPHPRMFALLNYLINHEGPGSMPAAMIFKAIAARNAFIKQVVGKDWVTYRDMIPEGYVSHKPETGSTFYFTNSIADQALTQVLAGHKNLPDAVRQVLARGRDEEWVVKEGISRTLNEFRPAMSDSLPAKMSKNMLTTWKQWILMNPFRVIKYNINNMSGDLDIAMAYDPKIITGYFTQAFKDLWAASKGKASVALMDELSELTKRGVVGSGMTAMDIPELSDVKSVKGLVDFFDGKSKGALTKWWTMSKKLSTLRENILRLAANRYFTDRLGKGEIVYGASRKEEVDAIKDQADKAAKLARELIGDYGNISHAGQYIRERMIPFYSWLEINAPRYVRLFRNLKDEGGGGIGALGGVLAWKATKLAVKASALMGLVMLWNAAFFPDEEDDLQEAGRESLHMILGRRADGSIITIRFQGALADALSWFGMGNPVEQAKKVISGTKGMDDLAKDVVSAAPMRLFQGFRPEPKLLYETLSGQSFFPEPMHPRPIRDTTEHILRTFSLDKIYNQVSGKPKQGGTWSAQMYRDIQSLALNEADPGEQAYYTSRKYLFDWLDKQGKEKPVAMPTNRSNSLYYYKQALKFGDFDAAEKYLKKYQAMGGKLHDVQGSIRRVHPLASLRLADRYKFKASLSPEQRETLSLATAWYKKHYVDTYQVQRKNAM